MKNRIFGLALALVTLFPAAALAQFIQPPNSTTLYPTYRAAITGLVTAASATDFFTIQGSATKTVYVTDMRCSGIGSTAGTPDIQVVKRSAANTTGTSTSPTVVPLDSQNAAGTAVVKAYTANPGALGAIVGVVDSYKLALPLAATGSEMQVGATDFLQSRFTQPIILRGVAQTLALNGNAATLAAGASLNCSATWFEK
jgi:hypothetical protein